MHAASCAPRCAASLEGPVLREVLYANDLQGVGFPAPGSPSAFQHGATGLSSFAVHATFRWRFILPRACRLLQSPSACALPTGLAASRRLPWGPRPSSRHQLPASTIPRGIPTPRSRSVPGVSHALDGLLRQKPSRVCFTPQPRPGFALQGFVPLRGAVRGFPRRVMPSCRWTGGAFDQRLGPRLQGLAPRGECGADRGCLDPDRSAPLLGFLLLRVLSSRSLEMPSHLLRPRPSPRWTHRG